MDKHLHHQTLVTTMQTTGVWQPIEYTGTYGTNGFYLPFKPTTQATGFNTVLYTGTGAAQAITGVGFEPDLVWMKRRTVDEHDLQDSVRGGGKSLISNSTAAEADLSGSYGISSFDANGFSLIGNGGRTNESGGSYAAWCWDAGSGSPVSNTDGTITSTVKANPATGFSVVTYTGNGVASTIGHGLNDVPAMIITKVRNNTGGNWGVYHKSIGNTGAVFLNVTNATSTSSLYWNNTTPTSSVFSVGSNNTDTNWNTYNFISYCFSEVAGYSKFGSYTGNGSTSGPTVTTGFKPAFVLIKKSSSSGTNWMMYDNTRSVANPANNILTANTNNAEATSTNQIDFNSDGFQITGSSGGVNTSGDTYIYMAFADTRDAQFNFDASGNKNNWTANNINSNASGDTTYDIMTDVPTLTDEDTANYAVLNPINKTGGTLSQANLYYYGGAGPTSYVAMSTIGMTEGKFYAEWLFESGTYSDVGICKANVNLSNYLGGDANGWMYYNGDGNKYTNGTAVAYGATYTSGDIIGIAFDADIGTLTFYKNGVSQGAAFTGLTDGPYFFAIGSFTTYGYFNFGQRPFAYTPPTGYKKLNTFNLPDSSIVDGSEN